MTVTQDPQKLDLQAAQPRFRVAVAVPPATTREVWKPHPEWSLDVSTGGRIRSQGTGRLVGFDHVGETNRPSRGIRYRRAWVGPGKNDKAYIHVLVLETFVGPRPEGYEADHADDDGFNNWLGNLQWVTREYNQEKARLRRARRLVLERALRPQVDSLVNVHDETFAA